MPLSTKACFEIAKTSITFLFEISANKVLAHLPSKSVYPLQMQISETSFEVVLLRAGLERKLCVA